MDNPARIIAITVSNGQIQPCIRILKGINVASRENHGNFNLRISFSYFSGGVHVEPIFSDQLVSSTVYLQDLDPQWIRARGTAVRLGPTPDAGSPIICTVESTIKDRAGNVVSMGTAETTSFTA